MGKRERVILIKGNSSNWYEQVIFIVNKNIPQENIPMDFVSEAENIINNYIRKSGGVKNNGMYSGPKVGIAYAAPGGGKSVKNKTKKKNKKLDFILNTILALGCIFLASVIAFGLLS